ncbi:MAG: hypothetical protein RLZZ440_1145, partial [Planctomycetota bacterium]
VIAIIATLIGLLLPAVQSARESARRTSCGNNLRQVGLGLQGHLDAKKRFPRARSGNNQRSHTWVVHILPFIEQGTVYDLFTMDIPGATQKEDGVNYLDHIRFKQTGAAQTIISTMFCPSAPRDTKVATTGPLTGYMCSDYAANYGPGWFSDPEIKNNSNSYGPFPLRMWKLSGVPDFRGLSLKQISDGLTKTLFVGEKWAPAGQYGKGSDDTTYTPRSPCHECANRQAGPEGLAAEPDTYGRYLTFGSHHQNVVPFVFGDGRVEFLSTELAGSVLVLLADRRDGETIPSY